MKKVIIAVVIFVIMAIGIVLLINKAPKSDFTDDEMNQGNEMRKEQSDRDMLNDILDAHGI